MHDPGRRTRLDGRVPRPFLLACVALCSVLLACSGAGASRPDGKELVAVEVDGRRRTAWVHVPPSWKPGGQWPLILMFHGGSGNDGMAVVDLWRSEVAGDFVLAFPNGQLDRPDEPGWGNGDADEVAHDLRFVRRLVSELVERFGIDAGRVFATGHSNGANMTFTLACRAPDLFAAFAPVNQLFRASVAEQCPTTTQRSMLITLGTADPKARFDGHPGALSGEAAIDFWQRAAGCATPPRTVWRDAPGDRTRTEHRTFEHCDRARVEALIVHGGGHAWPGSGHPDSTHDVSATQEIVRFFRASGATP